MVRAPAPQLWSHQPSMCHTTPSMGTQCPGLGRKNQITPGHLRPEKVPRVWGQASLPSPTGRCLEQ